MTVLTQSFQRKINSILGAREYRKSIYAVATYLDDTGTLRNTASQSKIVSYFDDPTSGVIALSGSLAVGNKLSADVLAFSDLDFEGSSYRQFHPTNGIRMMKKLLEHPAKI